MLKFHWDFDELTGFIEHSLNDKDNGVGKIYTEQRFIDFCRKFVRTDAAYGFCAINAEDSDMLFACNCDSHIHRTQDVEVLQRDFCRFSYAKSLEMNKIDNTMIIEISKSPYHTNILYQVNVYFCVSDFQRVASSKPEAYIKTMDFDSVKAISLNEGDARLEQDGQNSPPLNGVMRRDREQEVVEARQREEEHK